MTMHGKGYGGKRSWPNFKVICWHLNGGTEENLKKSISITGAEI
jgi:hypothetical protein